MNRVSSLRRRMIKTYLPASNAASLPQKKKTPPLQLCKSERAPSPFACEIKFCFIYFHLFFFLLSLECRSAREATSLLCNATHSSCWKSSRRQVVTGNKNLPPPAVFSTAEPAPQQEAASGSLFSLRSLSCQRRARF